MDSSQLDTITILLPAATAAEQAWVATLQELLAPPPTASRPSDSLAHTPLAPAGALPRTVIRGAGDGPPQVVFGLAAQLDLRLGGIQLRATAVPAAGRAEAPAPNGDGFPLVELAARLRGHIVRLDHTGVNLPSRRVPAATWRSLCDQLARAAALYRYPTGEEWPFVVPATAAELRDDIGQFVAGREPKFELVYDDFAGSPVLQIAVETDLERPELEELFPEPYGMAFPDLGDIFRAVFVAHPWPDLVVRVDLTYRNAAGAPTTWDTAEWLVTEGGRIQPAAATDAADA